MLIDGGPPDTWPTLQSRLDRMDPSDQRFDVAVISQGDAVEPILGLVAFDSFVVARAFGVVAVGRPKIIRAWGMPWEKSSDGSAPPSSPPSPS